MSDFNAGILEEFRTGHGDTVGPFPRSLLVVLHTVGARSGEQRETPLMSFPDGAGGRYVVASKAGAPTNPAWLHNVLARPEVEFEVAAEGGVTTVPATAAVLDGPERDRVYAWIAEQAPAFAGYQAKTQRVIPVVRLTPR